jgi:hypothetical protein
VAELEMCFGEGRFEADGLTIFRERFECYLALVAGML